MPRTDLFLKVTIDHDPFESPEKLAAEICRQIRKFYGVEQAELSSAVTLSDEGRRPAKAGKQRSR